MRPGERPLECERLAGTLRGLRARTGLSLAALAGKTGYSKSSWERYLNGKCLPPRQAVELLCELAGEAPGRPLALWEMADAVWSGRGGRPPRPAPPPASAGPSAAPEPSAAPGPSAAPEPSAAPAEPAAAVSAPRPRPDTARPAPGGPGGPGGPDGTGGAGGGDEGGGGGGKGTGGSGREPRRPARPRGPLRRELAIGVGCGLGAVAVVLPLVITGAFETRPRQAAGPPAASAAAAPASPGCHGSGCTGKDPESYGCGAVPPPATLQRRSFPGRTVVKIRYGAGCRAVWARIDLGRIGDRVEIHVPDHAPLGTEVKDEYDAEGSLSTPMVAVGRSGTDGVRACLVRQEKRHCFGPDGADAL
ncbi:helix-turn-helix domain-containing protein [Streptomyces sp. LB8]|uniref:helix-turn-helix domain-containing protein n=1 Tax=Streptomyces sp. LB8 TaxID=3042509 RepID=UPI0026472A68|nr:XRE family transcriptional regulator [Streptomyces sp. LB8]MDN5385116.1 helix-turn-helix domain-containing protein [Streptomyces sp. LB8]